MALVRLSADLFAPAVRVAHLDHGAQHVVPGLLILHHGIGEHAAVPADVAHRLGELAGLVAEPVAGVLGDVEPAVRIGDLAMPAGLLVIAGAEHGASFWATWKSSVQGRSASATCL